MSHVFQRYFDAHGHFPRVVVDSGVQRLTVEFAPGYVHISTSSPYAGEVYITRSAWFNMLRRITPITKLWAKNPAKNWDVPRRMHKAFIEENIILEQKRALKKTRRIDPDAMDRQRRRFLAAKARGKKRRTRREVEDDQLQGEYEKWVEIILDRQTSADDGD